MKNIGMNYYELNSFNNKIIIDRGCFGIVSKATYIPTGEEYALKSYDMV